jgi:hypothetical protein
MGVAAGSPAFSHRTLRFSRSHPALFDAPLRSEGPNRTLGVATAGHGSSVSCRALGLSTGIDDATKPTDPPGGRCFVLPYAHDVEPDLPHPAPDPIIASAVLIDFRPPEFDVRLWNAPAARTRVPKTAIDEDRESVAREVEIRSARNSLGVLLPAADFLRPESGFDDGLRGSVTCPADFRH